MYIHICILRRNTSIIHIYNLRGGKSRTIGRRSGKSSVDLWSFVTSRCRRCVVSQTVIGLNPVWVGYCFYP